MSYQVMSSLYRVGNVNLILLDGNWMKAMVGNLSVTVGLIIRKSVTLMYHWVSSQRSYW